MPAPSRPAAPPQALRSNPDTFSLNAELSIQYQWGALPTWIEAMGTFIQEQADAATAAALTGDVAPNLGVALNLLRVNAAGSGLEYRTPAQVRSDIDATITGLGGTATGAAVFTAVNAAAARGAIGSTAIGDALFISGSAAAARDTIVAPGRPQSAAGVGQWLSISAGVSTALALPAGGTWAFFVLTTSGTGAVAAFNIGVAAGGTTIVGASGGSNNGLAWRIQ